MTDRNSKKEVQQEVIGLFPAGGQASRIGPLPCSKELYPIGFRLVDGEQGLRPKVVGHYLLERMRLAGVNKAYIILRQGKWDLPAYLGDGSLVDLHLAYLMMNLPFGAPYTLDQAYPFTQDALVVFGFPDIIFEPDDAFAQLLARQAATQADIVLGLFPADQPHKADMVELDEQDRLRRIVIKPHQTHLRYTWIIAVWTPVFTHFMHEYLVILPSAGPPDDPRLPPPRELFVGDVIQAAMQAGLQVETVRFPGGHFLDIGTPEDLVKAVHSMAAPPTPNSPF